MKPYWVKKIGYKKGTLHHQLGIPKDKKLSGSLLKKIMKAKVGNKISYNQKKILITGLLKKRVNLAVNLRKMKKRGR
jgi:hypothetical protein